MLKTTKKRLRLVP